MGNEPLEYRKPERPQSQWRGVLLFLSILIAVGVGGLSGLASAFMLSDGGQWPLGAILIAGIVVLIGAAIAANRLLGMSAALAIFLASLCTFLLMIGMCSQFQLHLK